MMVNQQINEIYSAYGKDGAGELSIVYKKDGVTLSEAPTAVGNYSVTASASEGNFYKAAAEKTTSYRITKNIPGVTPPKAIDGLVFENTEKTLIEAGKTTGGTLMYSLDGTNYFADLPKATDAGNYTVYCKVFGDDNYNDTNEKNFDVEIAKAEPNAKGPTAKQNLIYNGTAQTLIEQTGSTTGGTLLYSLDDKNYLTELPNGTNAGDYTVYFKVDGGNNYNDVASKTLVVTIMKANSKFETKPSAKGNAAY